MQLAHNRQLKYNEESGAEDIIRFALEQLDYLLNVREIMSSKIPELNSHLEYSEYNIDLNKMLSDLEALPEEDLEDDILNMILKSLRKIKHGLDIEGRGDSLAIMKVDEAISENSDYIDICVLINMWVFFLEHHVVHPKNWDDGLDDSYPKYDEVIAKLNLLKDFGSKLVNYLSVYAMLGARPNQDLFEK